MSGRGGMWICMRSSLTDRKICRECIDDLRMGGKFEKSKMMQDITVYRMDELEEDEEEV